MPAVCLGRSALLASVGDALGVSPWVSLVGPPGSGKTLIARHSVAQRAPVAWVPVARVDAVEDVVTSVLRILGVQETPGDDPRTALTMALGEQPTTLVLDGVRDDTVGLGDVLADISDSIGDSRVLCTAHSVAGKHGEHVVRVGPLPVPAPGEPLDGPAFDVFAAALVRAGSPSQVLDSREDDLRRLLAATGGLPLLLEQVAVQVAMTGTASIVAARSLDDYVHASYSLLDEDTQCCFRRLACLPGPASLSVLQHVVGSADLGACASLVSGLARRSLLEVGPDGRIDLLPPIRRHGEQLRTEEDREAVGSGLLRWAESVAPVDANSGAADAPWLLDLPMMSAAIERGARDDETLPHAYDLANRVFSSLHLHADPGRGRPPRDGVLRPRRAAARHRSSRWPGQQETSRRARWRAPTRACPSWTVRTPRRRCRSSRPSSMLAMPRSAPRCTSTRPASTRPRARLCASSGSSPATPPPSSRRCAPSPTSTSPAATSRRGAATPA